MWLRARTFRVVLVVMLFAAVVFAPWWVSLLLALALTARFRAWEVIAAGIVYDLLWMPYVIAFSWEALPYATLIALALLFGFEPLRRQLLVGPASL